MNHQNHRVSISFKAQMSFTFSKTRGQTEIVGHLVMNIKESLPAASSIQALHGVNRRPQWVKRPNKGKAKHAKTNRPKTE